MNTTTLDQQAKRLAAVENVITVARWVFFILALASSYGHVRWAFAQLEPTEFYGSATSYMIALAIEAVIALLAYQRQQKKKHVQQVQHANNMVGLETQGLIFFMAISITANVLHGYHVLSGQETLTWSAITGTEAIGHLMTIMFALTLPLVVFFLGESVELPGEDGVVNHMLAERDQLANELDQTKTERDQIATQHDQLANGLDQTKTERDQLATQRDQLANELDQTKTERDQLATQRDQLANELDQTKTERDQLANELDQTKTERDRLAAKLDRLTTQLDQTKSERDQLNEFFGRTNGFIRDIVQYHAGTGNLSQADMADKYQMSKGAINTVLVRANGWKPEAESG